MATPVENVANRAWRRSTAESVDDDLGVLWRELAREAPVSRAVMSNLVIFHRHAASDDVDLTSPPEAVPVEDVVRNHPSRVILLRHDPNPPGSDAAPEIPLAAHVGVLTFGPPDARYGVEQIVIQSACTEAALPSIVRRLMLGDVPTSVWWTEDLSETHLLAPLVAMGRQLVYDSRRWGDVRAAVLALAPLLTDPFGPDLADVNWRRLLPVRQALVHAVRSRGATGRQRLTSVRIHYRRGEAALAWLFAGWLQEAGSTGSGLHQVEAGRVLFDAPGSIPLKPDTSEISVDEDSNLVDDVLTASFDDGLHVRLDSHLVSIDDPLGPAPFVVAAPNETAAEAVAAELRVLTQDTALHHALAALVARFGGA